MSQIRAAALIAWIALPTFALAAQPEDRHAALRKEQADATTHYRQAIATQSAAADTATKAAAAFRTCRNARLQILADPVIHRADAARRTLESARKGTEALRKELEGRRKGLESERRYRGKSRNAEYVAGEQAYADGMSERYLEPLESTVLPQIKDYSAGIGEYAKVLEKYAGFCAQPGYAHAAGEAFVKELAASVDALTTQSQQIAKAVSESRMSPDKAQAAVK
ncbi:MAG TPA: hypothetical protein VGK67_33350 [Myxococcales bacterium]|jgi:hypothetical protein